MDTFGTAASQVRISPAQTPGWHTQRSQWLLTHPFLWGNPGYCEFILGT